MSTNTFGSSFKVTTFGESHGTAIGAVIDGVPANIPLDVITDIQPFLDQRKPGSNIYTSPRKEEDKVTILSGTFEGKTLGTPITLLIYNKDCLTKDYENIKNSFRPNHGDFTWQQKFGFRDYRGGGRSSARETAARVAAGAIARKILNYCNTAIYGAVIQIGNEAINYSNWDYSFIAKNPFFAADKFIIPSWQNLIMDLKQKGDSIGAKIELHAKNVPVGLGEPVFDKLDAEIAKAIMSIPAVKAVEIGVGTAAACYRGSEMADEMLVQEQTITFNNNFSGGIQGGISNGNDIIVKFTVKPTSSIAIPKQSLNTRLEKVEVKTTGRHDPCVGIRATPVGEAMLAITLTDFLLRHRARFNFTKKPF